MIVGVLICANIPLMCYSALRLSLLLTGFSHHQSVFARRRVIKTQTCAYFSQEWENGGSEKTEEVSAVHFFVFIYRKLDIYSFAYSLVKFVNTVTHLKSDKQKHRACF